MIELNNAEGKLIRILVSAQSGGESAVYGFHPVFGFVSELGLAGRLRSRKNAGLRTRSDWNFRFSLSENNGVVHCSPLENCKVEKDDNGFWNLLTDLGKFVIAEVPDARDAATDLDERIAAPYEALTHRRNEKIMAMVAAALMFIFVFLPKGKPVEVAPPIIEPVEVKIVQEKQQSVRVPEMAGLPKNLAHQLDNAKSKVAIAQNLGFLSMLGNKNLTKALGGLPTNTNGSAGAGPGGKQGSGGELLVGLGQGVTRTTVGNSGMAGLGGVGTKGAGGGAGGYGLANVGSGNGKGVSTMPLGQDMVLEGGLDASVIQATIAKYLNEVRACYEEGLRKNPGAMGQVSMFFEIAGSGSVDAARVSKSSLGLPDVEQCISRKVLGWQFPKPRGGVKVKVNYPFLLRPVQS